MKNNLYCNLSRCRILRILFLLFVVLFTFYPILDAYANSINNSPVNMDMADDSFDASELLSHGYHASNAPIINLLLLTSALIENPFCLISQREFPSNAIKPHQSCSPLSSDLAPPLV